LGSNTGVVDFLFRRYSPVEGRWISPDPAGLAAVDITNPQTWNRYAYVANNPLSNVDPLGLHWACNNIQIWSCSWETDSSGNASFPFDFYSSENLSLNGQYGYWSGSNSGPDGQWIPWFVPTTPDLGFAGLFFAIGPYSILSNAIRHAEDIISNSPGCATFFGGNGVQTIDSTRYQFGPTMTESYGPGAGMLTQTSGPPPVVDVNPDPNAAFMSPPQQFYGVTGTGNIQAYFVMHEVAHALSPFTGFFDNDFSKNPDGTFNATGYNNQQTNNLNLVANCVPLN
jgi:RHS repeat-associated protein